VDLSLLGVKDSSRDLLMSAALSPPESALTSWRLWEAQHYRPQHPAAVRWLPLISWNLRRQTLPDETTALLSAARHQAWTANAAIWTSTEPVLQHLDDAGISWMLLKGAALAWTTYPDSSLRIIGDLDLLVDPKNAARTHRILDVEGWQPVCATTPGGSTDVHGRNYVKLPGGALDLHAFALRENCRAGADAGFWTRSVVSRIAGRLVRLPSPADSLLQVCVHGLRWNPVHACHWIADAAAIIASSNGRLDWDVLVTEAHKRDVALQIHEALGAVRQLAAVEVPAPVLHALMRPQPSWRARLELHVKARPLYGPGGVLLTWFDWRRLRSHNHSARSVGFATYLAHTMRLSSRRAILPTMTRHLMRRALP
jgi:hypothetical protein